VAVTLWESSDEVLREYLVSQADLVLAAGCDEPMEEVRRAAKRRTEWSKPVRFHQRGHRVHLTTVGREALAVGLEAPESGATLMEVVAMLASLDVVLGCQQGCQCSGVHFVEVGGERYYSPEAYGQAVAESLRLLNRIVPLDAVRSRPGSRSAVHDVSLEVEQGRGFAAEADGFRVVLESRPPTPDRLRAILDNCQGGEVYVVPVEDLMAIPEGFLSHMGPERLKVMSVALGALDDVDKDGRLLRYIEVLGAAGVRSIRTVGRGAFPLGTFPWDGLIPVDLSIERPPGHFTTVEFDQGWEEIFETYRLVGGFVSQDRA
jgi:hypothetical protein